MRAVPATREAMEREFAAAAAVADVFVPEGLTTREALELAALDAAVFRGASEKTLARKLFIVSKDGSIRPGTGRDMLKGLAKIQGLQHCVADPKTRLCLGLCGTSLPKPVVVSQWPKRCKPCAKERHAAINRAYRKANPERVAASGKAHRKANPEKHAAGKKAYYEANQEKAAASGKAYREANQEKVAARQKASRKANPAYQEAYQKAYRAKKKAEAASAAKAPTRRRPR